MASHVSVAARNLAADMLTREALGGWVALYPTLPVAVPRNVLIITAGNIPFVGVQDLICVLAAGHRAIVKPSSRDADNMAWVVAQLIDIDPDLPVRLTQNHAAPSPPPGGGVRLAMQAGHPDALIAMGSDETTKALREQFRGVPMLLRGNRSSLAVVDGRETAAELEGLADDVLMFSGLGCRNVSLVFVPRGYDLDVLRGVLAAREGGLEARYRNNLRHSRAMLRLGGAEYIDAGAALLVEARDFPAAPSVLHYSFYDAPAEVDAWIAAHATEIQCVATHSSFGQTQHPRLTDYPDGVDTMKFLMTI
jgi:hypothetical protein